MISFGIDILLKEDPVWKSQPMGMITNAAAFTNTGIPSRKALIDGGFNIRQLFSPEHGLDVQGADGAYIYDGIDSLTGLPIISLYGSKLSPAEDDLVNIDMILFDIPDVGVRFYTYLWTLSYALESCAKWNKKLVLLDRPNPIGGYLALAEGPMLDDACSSFIGRWNIPVRHSCTLGELAYYFQRKQNLLSNLLVIPCEGWHRNMLQPNWGNIFVPTSPAIQSFTAMQLYAGLCFLEATNVHEGRGTEFSFQSVSAPWLEIDILKGLLQNMFEEELTIETIHFVSGSVKYENQLCNGLRFMVKDAITFKPVFFGLTLIKLIKDIHPHFFTWDSYKTNANPTGSEHLDKLTGIKNAAVLFDLSLPSFLATITKATSIPAWKEEISDYLLY
jgi:uncharacterized protein YbbC (DUF1343 family)